MRLGPSTVALLFYNFRIGRVIFLTGSAACIALPTLFHLIEPAQVADRPAVPLGWVGWVNFHVLLLILAPLLAGELYGRDAADGATFFFMALPVSRFHRLVVRGAVLLSLLCFWFVIDAGVALVLARTTGTPVFWKSQAIVILGALVYSGALCCACISAFIADRTGNIALAVIIGLALTGGAYALMRQLTTLPWFVQGLIFCLAGALALSMTLLYQLDVEIEKE